VIELEVHTIHVAVIEVKMLEVVVLEVAELGTVVEVTAFKTETVVEEEYVVQSY
jgi:hypothetical protein